MGRRSAALAAVAVLAALVASAPAAAKRIVTQSPDSLAPPNAPAHWLPPEPWVYNHWLPYDEGRLYRLLKIRRIDLWRQLRDDRRTLGQLAERRGWSAQRLAAALVAPEARRVGARRSAELRDRALRTITQGHLAQHVFFHSLHQFAIPSEAPTIFGVTDARFRELRRSELSPLAIARLHGRSPGRVEALSIAVLRERAAAGVRGGAMTRAQADLLLRRQLSQLPRWLDQARYNGPPPTHGGALLAVPRDYASNPAISADGRHVAYESYRQKLPLAVQLGEIAVLRADLETGASTLLSTIDPPGELGPQPSSAYNATISGDGGLVAYESAAGNQNFAKRYGRIGVLLCDLSHVSTTSVERARAEDGDSQSAYNPELAADGSRIVFQAVRDARTTVLARDLPDGAEVPVAAGRPAGGATYADPYEPRVSGDGSRIVYTLASGRVADPRSGTSSVRLRDLRGGTTTTVSRATGAEGAVANGFSADPSISRDGRWVAFTSDAPNLGRRHGSIGLFLRDLGTGRTVSIPTGSALPLDPEVADGGTVVVFTAVRGPRASVMAWTAATGALTLVSRASGAAGAAANRWSDDSSISAAGDRVAFASIAGNLDAAKRDDTRGVFVRDLVRQTTRLVSSTAAAYEVPK